MDVIAGDEVLARCSDGLAYKGAVVETDKGRLELKIRFEDEDELWARYSDIRLITKKVSSSERCRACLVSDKKLDICAKCGEGFHKRCHVPVIEEDSESIWHCRFCVLSESCKAGGIIVADKLEKHLGRIRVTLPYKIEELRWDVQFRTNEQEIYCYCGSPGDWNLKMLQCLECRQWFHEACLLNGTTVRKPLLNGDLYYNFKCAPCSNGEEWLQRLELNWSEAVHLIIYNLGLITPARFYRLETDIIRYAKMVWDDLLVERLDRDAWDWETRKRKIVNVLETNKERFKQYNHHGHLLKLWGLHDPDAPPKPSKKTRRIALEQKRAQLNRSLSSSTSETNGKLTLKISLSPSSDKKKSKSENSEDDVFEVTPSQTSRSPLPKYSRSPKTVPPTNLRKVAKRESAPRGRGRGRGRGSRGGSTPCGSTPCGSRGRSSTGTFLSKNSSELQKPNVPKNEEDNENFTLSSAIPDDPISFDTPWRMASGEGFRVVGRRVEPSGRVSYCIEWEGNSNEF